MRRYLALGALAFLAISAGCSVFGPGQVDPEKLAANATYEWNTSANVTISVEKNDYKAVYKIRNRSTLSVYQFQRFNNQQPIDPEGVQFRYPNGTVVGPEAMAFDKTRSRTTITLPAANGSLGLTAPKRGKRIRVPTVVPGPYEVILPENARVRYFLLGRVAPGGHVRTIEDGRVHLRWETMRGDRIVVRYYLQRDLLIFGSVVAIGFAALLVGLGYFWLQLRELKERREEVALDDT